MADDGSGQVTELLQRWTQGDERALRDLVPLVYKDLRKLAHYHLQSERSDHTLQSTALVHEAFLRIMGGQRFELQGQRISSPLLRGSCGRSSSTTRGNYPPRVKTRYSCASNPSLMSGKVIG